MNLHNYGAPLQIKNYMKSTFVTKVAIVKIQKVQRALVNYAPPIDFRLKSEVFIGQLHSSMNKSFLKSTSVIKVATMKNTDDFSLHKGSHHVQPPN